MKKFLVLLLLAIVFYNCTETTTGSAANVADQVYFNAEVYTVNKNQPRAQAVAVKGGKILFVGSNEEVKAFQGQSTEMIDCQGKFLMPGFIEGHGHIHGLGSSLVNLNLMQAASWEEIVAMVEKAVASAQPGEWIIGRGWHQEKWNPAPARSFLKYPYHDELSRVSPNNPVLLTHASGHASFVNAKAMELAGITSSTKSPAGGEIVKDNNGVILGVLEETAAQLVHKKFTEYQETQSEEQRKATWQKSMELAEQECLKHGITSFQDAGSSMQQVKWMKELARDNKLKVRHWVMIRDNNTSLRNNADVFSAQKEDHDYLKVRAIKVSLDGALGSYGAWLLQPYSDRAGWSGQPTFNTDSLKAIADFAWQQGLQLCVHAIGDRANREVLDIYEATIGRDASRDHRWRVEHAQHVNPVEIPRFRNNKVIASMQGVHCTSDAPFVPKRLGEQRSREGAYVWRSFLDSGVVVTNGTDVPVENIDPLPSYFASVTRQLKDGTRFYPEQRMTREEALYSYTMANAFAAFEEHKKGSLEVGKLADMVLLSNDLIECKDEEILQTQVLMTIVGGKALFKR